MRLSKTSGQKWFEHTSYLVYVFFTSTTAEPSHPSVDFRFILRSHKTSESHISHLTITHTTVNGGCFSSRWCCFFLQRSEKASEYMSEKITWKLPWEFFFCFDFTTPKHLMLHYFPRLIFNAILLFHSQLSTPLTWEKIWREFKTRWKLDLTENPSREKICSLISFMLWLTFWYIPILLVHCVSHPRTLTSFY